MGLFSTKREKAFKTFEKLFKKVWTKKAQKREEVKGQILSPDLLRRRKEVTKNGRRDLVLQYGTKGQTIKYTLDELNKMAQAMGKAEVEYREEARGVPIDQLIRAARIPVNFEGKRRGMSDFRKAVHEISNATLYKIEENLLTFRVTASGRNTFKHYQVRIRLEDWRKHMRESGAAYTHAARQTCAGRVSFDCSCGRHQYWFRYLATIGGFGLDPAEHGFPKIRNPGLRGACCKHVVKTLAVLQNGAVHVRLGNEMQQQAKKKGWFTKILKGSGPEERLLKDADLEELEKSGTGVNIEKEFKNFTNAKTGFDKKMKNPETKKKMEALKKAQVAARTYKQIAENEKQTRTQLEKDLLAKDLESYLFKAVYKDKMSKSQAVKQYADSKGIQALEIQPIADKINL